jgi:hypothetical protein
MASARERLRHRVFAFVEADVPGGERYDAFVQLLIAFNVLALVLETEPSLRATFGRELAVFGIGVVALPPGILGAAFVEEVQAGKQRTHSSCPHCGGSLRAEPADGGGEPPVRR